MEVVDGVDCLGTGLGGHEGQDPRTAAHDGHLPRQGGEWLWVEGRVGRDWRQEGVSTLKRLGRDLVRRTLSKEPREDET